ncbi:hypothetical protein J6590_104572 [Homalodisca vitripennis]|nr:hypothetical protein J6590_104572 [Homalodisca vitripennis]
MSVFPPLPTAKHFRRVQLEETATDSNSTQDDLTLQLSQVSSVIVVNDVVYHGTIIIENGTLATKDFIDSNRNISARNVVNLGIPLNKTVIDKHFIFKSPFKNCCYKLESKDLRLSFTQTGDQPDLDPSSSPGARHITVLCMWS